MVLDTTPPSRLTGVIVVPRSGGFDVTFSPAVDAHLSHYQVSVYAGVTTPARFEDGLLFESDGTQTSVTVTGLDNRIGYVVILRACDAVGLCGEPSQPVRTSLGASSANLEQKLSNAGTLGAELQAYDRDLWLVGRNFRSDDNADEVVLHKCSLQSSRCTEDADWLHRALWLAHADYQRRLCAHQAPTGAGS